MTNITLFDAFVLLTSILSKKSFLSKHLKYRNINLKIFCIEFISIKHIIVVFIFYYYQRSYEILFYVMSACGHYFVQTDLYKLVFCICSFEKLLFFLSVFSSFSVCSLFGIWCYFYKLTNICMIGNVGTRCSVILFSHSFGRIWKLYCKGSIMTIISKTIMLPERFWVFL